MPRKSVDGDTAPATSRRGGRFSTDGDKSALPGQRAVAVNDATPCRRAAIGGSMGAGFRARPDARRRADHLSCRGRYLIRARGEVESGSAARGAAGGKKRNETARACPTRRKDSGLVVGSMGWGDRTYPLRSPPCSASVLVLLVRHVVTSEEKTPAEETCRAMRAGRGVAVAGSDEWFSPPREKANVRRTLWKLVHDGRRRTQPRPRRARRRARRRAGACSDGRLEVRSTETKRTSMRLGLGVRPCEDGHLRSGSVGPLFVEFARALTCDSAARADSGADDEDCPQHIARVARPSASYPAAERLTDPRTPLRPPP